MNSVVAQQPRPVLSPACTVSVNRRGVRVPKLDDAPSVPLGLPELLVIERLAGPDPSDVADVVDEVSSRTGTEPIALTQLLEALDERRLLLADTPSVHRQALAAAPNVPISVLDDADELELVTPLLFRPHEHRFESLDHEGRVLARLSAAEVMAASLFASPLTVDAAMERLRDELTAADLNPDQFTALVGRLRAVGLLTTKDRGAEHALSQKERRVQDIVTRTQLWSKIADGKLKQHLQEEAEHTASTGFERVRVVPVGPIVGVPLLSLGMVLSYAMAFESGRLNDDYDFFHPGWVGFYRQWSKAPGTAFLSEAPAVFLYSSYIWSSVENLAMSDEAKSANPLCVNVHGGPDVPRYPGDVENYFASHPHVDVAVHGEGEVTAAEMLAALAPTLRAGKPDLEVLRDVPGLSYRGRNGVVRTADRDRLSDLDQVPSPFLTGVFDAFDEGSQAWSVIVETNRGCPYGCTFCDWGSATLSRIRQFELERVLDELEWCARANIDSIMIADANFGILERDVTIAEKMAELKERYGYPKVFHTNYAKNTVKHLEKIVAVMAEAGIVTEGLISLQSMDPGTLKAVKRSNIKTEKYDALAAEFRRARLPLFVDLMLGLPGSTVASFCSDLQACINREMSAKIFPTEVLVNSPMNEPEYREQHQIVTMDASDARGTTFSGARSRALVVSTASFTREDYEEMYRLRRMFFVAENFAVLRHVARYVRYEKGMTEIDFLIGLRGESVARNAELPTLALAFQAVPHLMVPPLSWRAFVDELHGYLVTDLGLLDDSSLTTVLDVQHAILPAHGRSFPFVIDLAHDYAAWYWSMVDAKDNGHQEDWPDVIPALRTLGPATFEVTDPGAVCRNALGFSVEQEPYASWELASPISRATVHDTAAAS